MADQQQQQCMYPKIASLVLCVHNNRSMNIIYLVRDPIEIVLSSYFYHSQEPAPEPKQYQYTRTLQNQSKKNE